MDLRNIQTEYSENSGINSIKLSTHDGEQLGYFDYKVYDYEDDDEKYVYIMNVLVYPEYQNMGVGQILYKEFGKVYSEKYSGFELKRDFLNPIAEYAYRKAVGLGYIPESTLVEEKIRRTYNDADEELIKDLRNKLPESVRGPEVWAKLSEKIDCRNMTFDININQTYYSEKTKYIISAMSQEGKRAGELVFMTYPEYQIIEITGIDVWDAFQKVGLGTKLYQEFGKVYNSEYDGWKVARKFINPVAEYSFRKAVSLGYISPNAITEEAIKREYTHKEKELAVDLRKKLPEEHRGPEVWANIKKAIQ